MKRTINVMAAGILAFALHGAAWAQEPDVRDRLRAAGATPAYVERVAEIAAAVRADGLPVEPIVTKALEGWAKRGRVPEARIFAGLETLRGRLAAGRDATVAAGMTSPPGAVVAGAAEALGRGLTPEQVGDVIRAAPTPEAAATGLVVAASLAAQGLETAAAVRAVNQAHAEGGQPEQVFELPSVLAGMLAEGIPMADVARRIFEGGGLPLPPAVAGPPGARPGVTPPNRGSGTEPPSNAAGRRN